MYAYISKKGGKTWDSLKMQEKNTTFIFIIVADTLKKINILQIKKKYRFDR